MKLGVMKLGMRVSETLTLISPGTWEPNQTWLLRLKPLNFLKNNANLTQPGTSNAQVGAVIASQPLGLALPTVS